MLKSQGCITCDPHFLYKMLPSLFIFGRCSSQQDDERYSSPRTKHTLADTAEDTRSSMTHSEISEEEYFKTLHTSEVHQNYQINLWEIRPDMWHIVAAFTEMCRSSQTQFSEVLDTSKSHVFNKL